MSQYEFVRFEQEDAQVFRSVVLPDVMDQLLLCSDFESESLVCAAVMDGDVPVAAAVAQLLADHEVYLHSLFVDPAHRRKHLASEMLDRILTEALDVYKAFKHFEESSVDVFLHTEYVLPKEAAGELPAFLKAYGFKDFLEKEPCYLFTSDELKVLAPFKDAFTGDYNAAPSICSLASYVGEDAHAAAEYLDSLSIDADPDYVFLLRDSEEILAAMFAVYGEEKDFSLMYTAKDPADSKIYLSLLKPLLQALNRDYPGFSLTVSTDRSGYSKLWAEIAAQCGIAFLRTEAGMYIAFE